MNELGLTDGALIVLQSRYLRRDSSGDQRETPQQLFSRVAHAVVEAEQRFGGSSESVDRWRAAFYEVMTSRTFLPNSPTLMNAGQPAGILSACFVLPVEDSIEGIFSSVHDAALIQRAGGGTGFSFSRLRPKGDLVASSGGRTSGPIAFLNVFSEATAAIQQGAFRRGANMGVMHVEHPDIIDFINAKQIPGHLSNFNLSVAVTERFMRQVIESPDCVHIVRNPRDGSTRALKRDDGRNWTVGEVFDLVIRRAWENGEPGILFLDCINAANPTPKIGRIEAVNPCGEQPLLPYESCNLGSINVGRFVQETATGLRFDANRFRQVIHVAGRFLDNVIEVNHYPIPECERMAKANRKIGLGIMGFADLLIQMGIAYDSSEALALADEVMSILAETSHAVSRQLAEERGTFPNWEHSVWAVEGAPMRNAATTCIAPTGSVSIIAGCSGGVEPLFSVVFERNVLDGQHILEVNPQFEKIAKARGFYSYDLIGLIHERGSVQGLREVPEDIQRVFVTAHDIDPEWHVRMQAVFQKHCDAAVSKTVNLRHDAGKNAVRKVFLSAYELGCKGVTVYRDGCRSNQPMALAAPGGAVQDSRSVRPMVLPPIMSAVRIKQATPFGNMHIMVVVEPETGREREVFAQLGKGGDVANSDLEAICRLTSLYLRVNGSIEDVVGQLKGIGSTISIPTKEGRICSLADGLARGLEKFQHAVAAPGLHPALRSDPHPLTPSTEPPDRAKQQGNGNADPSSFKFKCACGGELVFSEGCTKCPACGFAQC